MARKPHTTGHGPRGRRTAIPHATGGHAQKRSGSKKLAGKPHSLGEGPAETKLLHRVPTGSVKIWAEDPPYSVQTLLGPTQPIISNGFGGWKTVDREARTQLVEYQGNQTFQLVFEVMMDCFAEETFDASSPDVEAVISALESLAQVNPGMTEPPLCRIDGNGSIPHDIWNSPKSWWGLNDIAYTEQCWNWLGRRNRAQATLTFLEFHGEREAKTGKTFAQLAADKKKKAAGSKRKTYTVRAGDTLTSIAARQLAHTKFTWHDIARLNNIHDPRAIHLGEVLKMP